MIVTIVIKYRYWSRLLLAIYVYILSDAPSVAEATRQPNREWADEEMSDCIAKILSSYTYQDVTRDNLVPISTLWTRWKLVELPITMQRDKEFLFSKSDIDIYYSYIFFCGYKVLLN